MARILTSKDLGTIKIKAPETPKISFSFDLDTLNMFIGFVFKDSRLVTRKTLDSLYKVLDLTDTSQFKTNIELEERFRFIKKALEGYLVHNIENRTTLKDFTKEINNSVRESIIEKLPLYTSKTSDELRYISRVIEDRLRFSFVEQVLPKMIELIQLKESKTYLSYGDIVDPMSELCKEFVNKSRKASAIEETDEFSLNNDSFDHTIVKLVEDYNHPARILYTGIRELNTLLSPGYLGGRLYTYLGLPAGFKSGILLKSLSDIRKYNPNIKLKDSALTPCALMITMENTVVETVERLFNMTVPGVDLAGMTAKQITKALKKEGELTFKGNGDVNLIIRYYPNMSISTDDLYTIIDDLADIGQEVVALVLDYIKRIRPARRAKDEKEELKNVTNELKNIAIHYNIPVITAHQLNRESARIIDTATNGSRRDATSDIGRTHTGSAWEVIENSDWACVINMYSIDKKENEEETTEYYLTFKRVKIRYKPIKISPIFSHPFESNNRIKLIDDVNLDKSLSIADINNVHAKERFSRGDRFSLRNRVVDMDDDDDVSSIIG